MNIEAIINGRIRPSASYRELGPFRVGDAGPDDLAFALKCARQRRRPQPIAEALRVLVELGRDGGWFSDSDVQWIAQSSHRPIKLVRAEFTALQTWLAGVDEWLKGFVEIDSAGELIQRGQSTAYVRGLPTLLIQAGDAGKAVTVAHSIIAGGHNVVIKTTTQDPLTTFLFTRACMERGLSVPQIVHLSAERPENRAAVQKAIAQCRQSICFGEDRTIHLLYGGQPWNPDHRVTPFWTGRSGAILLPDADLERAAAALVRGMISLGRGNDCASTKRVLVPEELAEELEARLRDLVGKLVIGAPLDESTDACPDPDARAEALKFFADANVFHDDGCILGWCQPSSKALREELPYPTLALQRYRASEDPAALADRHVADTASGRAVSTAIFTQSEEKFRALAGSLATDKVVWNRASSTMDFRKQHSGSHMCFSMMPWREMLV